MFVIVEHLNVLYHFMRDCPCTYTIAIFQQIVTVNVKFRNGFILVFYKPRFGNFHARKAFDYVAYIAILLFGKRSDVVGNRII